MVERLDQHGAAQRADAVTCRSFRTGPRKAAPARRPCPGPRPGRPRRAGRRAVQPAGSGLPGGMTGPAKAALVRVCAVRTAVATASSRVRPHKSVSTNSASALTTMASSCFSRAIASGGRKAGPSGLANGASAWSSRPNRIPGRAWAAARYRDRVRDHRAHRALVGVHAAEQVGTGETDPLGRVGRSGHWPKCLPGLRPEPGQRLLEQRDQVREVPVGGGLGHHGRAGHVRHGQRGARPGQLTAGVDDGPARPGLLVRAPAGAFGGGRHPPSLVSAVSLHESTLAPLMRASYRHERQLTLGIRQAGQGPAAAPAWAGRRAGRGHHDQGFNHRPGRRRRHPAGTDHDPDPGERRAPPTTGSGSPRSPLHRTPAGRRSTATPSTTRASTWARERSGSPSASETIRRRAGHLRDRPTGAPHTFANSAREARSC